MFIRNNSTTFSENLLYFAIGLTLLGTFLVSAAGIFSDISIADTLLCVGFICLMLALVLLPAAVILELTPIGEIISRRFNKIKLFLNYRVIKFSWDKLWKLKQNY